MQRVIRWGGKPTSGRYVYRCVSGWTWQCDLHGDELGPEDEGPGGDVVSTMGEAFHEAYCHALTCGHLNLYRLHPAPES
jgi:hypothetical protein